MKVLYFTNIPSPYRIDFFNKIGKECELTVVFERQTAKGRDEKWNSQAENCFKQVYLNGMKIGEEASFTFKAIKYLNRLKHDICVIDGYSTPTYMILIAYARLLRKSYVISSDGALEKKDRIITKAIKRFLISGASAWLCTGKISSAYLQTYGAVKEKIYIYPFTSLKKEDIISNLLGETDRNLLKSRLGISEEKVIISVGQFIHRKGYDIFLKACSHIDKKTGVYLIGGKPPEEYIRVKSDLKLANVHFIDFKTKDELKEFYKIADLFVLPTRYDIWGLVINEAMANGLPIVTTDKCVAGLELIEDSINGYIVPVEDEIILSEKISSLLANKETCGLMAQSNITKIQKYTIEDMAEQHFKIFSNIISKLSQ